MVQGGMKNAARAVPPCQTFSSQA